MSLTMIRVLLIEDNPIDVELLGMAFDESGWLVDMKVAADGDKAVAMLADGISNPDARPHLVILDLNLPCRDGADVLRAMRGEPELARVPVVILSSSPEDVIHSKLSAAGVTANAHHTKPFGLDEYMKLGTILRDWFEETNAAAC